MKLRWPKRAVGVLGKAIGFLGRAKKVFIELVVVVDDLENGNCVATGWESFKYIPGRIGVYGQIDFFDALADHRESLCVIKIYFDLAPSCSIDLGNRDGCLRRRLCRPLPVSGIRIIF